MTDPKPYTLDRIVRILITAGIIAGMIWLTGYLSDVLIPFAVALLLAYLTNPLIVLVQKKDSQPSCRRAYQLSRPDCDRSAFGLAGRTSSYR